MGRLVLFLAAAAAVVFGLESAAGAGSGLRLVRVVGGLSSPLYATAPAGERGRLYVVERSGTIRVVEKGRIRSEPFLDIRDRVVSGGEQGLLGLAFAPDYAKSRIFVVNYTGDHGDTHVVRYRSDGTRAIPSSATRLLLVQQPYANHNGGMVAYGPDGLLYVGMGDGGSGGDPENRSQNMGTLLGKLVRLDPRKPAAAPTVVALGLRNPWRFSFDRAGGLWIGDVGQGEIEEIDRVAFPWNGLLNFGWDVYEGTASFESKPLGPGRLVRPVTQYDHSVGCSVTGGYVYRGSVVAARGRYFYGDYCSGRVWSLRLVSGVARQIRQEPVRVDDLASFGEDAAGELYLVSLGGTVYRLAG